MSDATNNETDVQKDVTSDDTQIGPKVVAGEPKDNLETSSEETEQDIESSDETDAEASDDSESSDEADDAFVEGLAVQLREVDSERFESLTQLFQSGEPIPAQDIEWIAEISKLDKGVVRYGIALQQEAYQASLAKTVSDAEAELGSDIPSLIDRVQKTASSEQLAQWQNVIDFASRSNDSNLTLSALRDMKRHLDAQDKSSGGKVKTLGHLGSSQGKTTNATVEVANEPSTPVVATEPVANPFRNHSSVALAQLAQQTNLPPDQRGLVISELKGRGVI